jgi:hypothetical protein
MSSPVAGWALPEKPPYKNGAPGRAVWMRTRPASVSACCRARSPASVAGPAERLIADGQLPGRDAGVSGDDERRHGVEDDEDARPLRPVFTPQDLLDVEGGLQVPGLEHGELVWLVGEREAGVH